MISKPLIPVVPQGDFADGIGPSDGVVIQHSDLKVHLEQGFHSLWKNYEIPGFFFLPNLRGTGIGSIIPGQGEFG